MKIKLSQIAIERIASGDDPELLVHRLTDPDGNVYDISSGLTYEQYYGGGYTESYACLYEVANGKWD